MDTIKVVNDILVERFELKPEQLVPSALLKDDLKLDSLDFVDMIVTLEGKIGGTLPQFDFMSIKTLQDIYDLVKKIFDGVQK